MYRVLLACRILTTPHVAEKLHMMPEQARLALTHSMTQGVGMYTSQAPIALRAAAAGTT